MTQKAQLQKEKVKDKDTSGPSTPVIITGGGSYEDVGRAFGPISIGSSPEGGAPVEFVTHPVPRQSIWRESASEQSGVITDVIINGTPQQQQLTHPVHIMFESGEFARLFIREVAAGPGGVYTLSMTAAGPGDFHVERSASDGDWIRSESAQPGPYDSVTVGDAETPLGAAFTVQIDFQVAG